MPHRTRLAFVRLPRTPAKRVPEGVQGARTGPNRERHRRWYRAFSTGRQDDRITRLSTGRGESISVPMAIWIPKREKAGSQPIDAADLA